MSIRSYLFIPVSLFFVLIPALTLEAADIEVDTSAAKANQAILGNAPNGVPIIDIVKPTSQGLSHNKFKNYNVAEQGLILNNSKVVTDTQLAGYISYNKNLTGDAAKLILNEVTGTNRSLLKGYTEVAGQAADVIVANPNGISVNGGGFINTPNATLTTGSLLFDGSLLKGFDVSGGDILIEGEGFNTSNIDQVNLYTKALQLNAKLYAKKLAVVTGDNDIAMDGTVTPKGTIDTGIAIDSSQLGGIYANTITLVSNDKGVGVNLPPEVYATDSLEISADGNIVMADVSAANNVVVTSESRAITSTSDVVAKNINIDAKTDFLIDEDSILEADDTLEINADKVDNKGKLTAPETNGKVVINAHTEVNNNGHINADNIEVTTATLKNQNEIYSENDVVVTADEIDNRKLIQANDDLDISSDTLTNRIDGVIYAEDNIDVVAETMENDGAVVGKNLDINAGNIVNKGALYSKNDMTVRAKTLLNHEMIRSNDEINLLIEKSLTNKKTGVIYSDGAMTIAANDAHDKINTVTNNGLIQSHSTINITAKTLDNVTSAPVYKNQTISSTQKISRGGSNDFDTVTTTKKTQVIDIPSDPSLILADSDITIDVETLNNFYSLIASDGDINLLADEANNVGKIIVTTTTTVTKQYRNERYCSISGPSGSCLHHKHRAGYRGSFTNTQTGKLPVVNYGIQARGSITGNVVNLNNSSSIGGVLTDAEVAQKETQITEIETNSVDLQQSQESLDDSNENAVRALGEVPDMDALIEGIVTEEDLTSFKDDLATLKNSLQLSIDNDKLNIETLSAIIAYSKTLDLTATTAGDLAVLESSLASLKTNLAENEANMESFKTVNDAIVVIEDVATQKEALLDIDTNVRAIITDNTRILDELVAVGAVDTLVGEYEALSNGLSSEIKTSSDLRASTTKSEITADDGLYQTNSRPSLQPTDDVTYSTNTSSDAFASTLTLPEGKYGLFVVNADSEHPYLIESNPIYTNYATFIGSDYMMSKLDFRPEKTVQRLGDAMYETTLVRDSVMKLSGQRRLGDYATDLEQYKALMDNAIALEESLNLQIGISLTHAQIANLTKDIVWMEERVIDGHSVLVPVVYLATVDEERMKNGSSIQSGEALELAATGAVNNQAGLYSDGDMHIAADSITNQGGELSAGGDMALEATTGIDNVSGQLASEGDMTLSADTINLETAQTQKQYHYAQGSQSITATGRQSQVKANGNVTLTAQDGITLKGAQIAAGQDALLVAANGDIQVDTVQAQEEYAFNLNNGYNRGKRVVNTGSEVSAQNISVKGNELAVTSSTLNADEVISLEGAGQVSILAANDSDYRDTQITSSSGFMGSKTKRNMSYKETVVGSELNAKNITLNSKDEGVTLEAAKLKAQENIVVAAKKDIEVIAKQYREGELHYTQKSSWGGLSQSASMDRKEALSLREASLETEALNVILKSGNDIKVISSNIDAASDVQLQASNDVLISAAQEFSQQEKWSKSSSFNPLNALASISTFGLINTGPVYEMESHLRQGTNTKAKSSLVQSGGNIDIDAGRAKVVGSKLQADGNITAKTDVGSIEVLAAQEESNTYAEDKKIEISLGSVIDTLKNAIPQDTSDTKGKLTLAKATYNQEGISAQGIQNKSASVTSHGNIDFASTENITIQGSHVQSDNGDITLTAEQNVNITEATNTQSSETRETHASAEISATVQNEYAEAAKAYLQVIEATKQLQNTKKEYKKYKSDLDELEANLATLKQEYADNVPGIDKDDLDEMQELIDDIKGDEKYYLAAIAAATVNLTSKTTLAVQQSATAASSSGTYGFSVGLALDVEGSKTHTNTTQTESVGSTVSGKNIKIATNTAMSSQTTIQGSDVQAQNALSIETGELNVLASADTYSQTTAEKNMNGSVSMSVYGAAAGPQVDLGYGENNAQSSSLTHTNSTLNATTIRTETTGDTNIKGGNVDASDLLSMVVGGDLNIESQKDSYDRASKGMNVSAGVGMGANGVSSISGGYGASVGRIRQKETVLSSVTGGEVDIKVANNTHLKGALLAAGEQQADGHFADNGNLHLKTDTLTYTNTSNSLYSSDNSFNVSTSVGFAEGNDEQGNPETKASLGTVNSSFSMGKTNEKSKTLATLGQGNIEVTDKEHSDDPERLNRDTDKVEKGLYAVSQHAGAEMALDTRILTEEGRKEIKEDADRTVLLGEALHDAATKGSVAVATDAQDGQTGVFEHIQRKQDFYTAAKSFYNDPDNDKNRDILANPENYSPQEREDANQAMIFYIAKATGVKPSEVVQVLDDERRGFYSDETGKIYVSDNANQNAKETATTVAHEASHSIDAEAFGTENKSDTYKENREEYAQLIDDAFADKLDQEYASDGYDLSTITHQNSNTQVNSVTNQPRQVDKVLASNTEDYNKLDKSKGENFLPALVAVPAVAGLVTAAIANPKVQEVTKQALNNAMEGLKTVSRGIVNFFEPDAQYTDEELAIAAKTYLQMREYRDTSTNMGDWVAMDNLMQQISPEVAAAAEKLRAEGISSNTGGSEIVEGGVSNYTNPVHEGMDSSTVSVADKDQDVWTTETHVTDEKGLGTTESPADSGVEPLLVVNSNTHNNDNNNFDSTRRAVPGEIFYKTTKEATEAAQILGFVKIKEKSHGEVVYYNKKRKLYMSRDVGSGDGNGAHNGGVWKLAKSPKELGSKQTRLGTFDADLKQIGD